MQIDEITSLKARIVRLEEVNELEVSEKYVEGFTKFFKGVTYLSDSDMGHHVHNMRAFYRAQHAAKTLVEFDRTLDLAKEEKTE